MAKFKPGDKVTFVHHRGFRKDGSEITERKVYKVSPDKARSGYVWLADLDGRGNGMEVRESDLALANSVCSRNAVVQKALNAVARNGGIDDFKVGDRVMVRSIVGFTPTDPKPGTVTEIYKSDNRIAVKKDDGGRGLFDASMVTKNACGTARNAMQDARSCIQECNKFIPEANAMIREWDAFYKKMTAKRKWYDSKMTELWDGFYRIDKGDPDYDKARAVYDALRDVSRSARAVHLFYGV